MCYFGYPNTFGKTAWWPGVYTIACITFSWFVEYRHTQSCFIVVFLDSMIYANFDEIEVGIHDNVGLYDDDGNVAVEGYDYREADGQLNTIRRKA